MRMRLLIIGLIKEGMITKKRDTEDGRSVNIYLTPEGQQKKEIAADAVIGFNTRIRDHIAEDELNIFFDVMEKINEVVDMEVQNLNNKNNE